MLYVVNIISGSQASRKVLEDWASVDSDVDDVAEALNSKTSKHISKSWTVTTVITSYFIAIWTFITVTYTHTVDAAYRLVGHHRDTHFCATPHRKLVFCSLMCYGLALDINTFDFKVSRVVQEKKNCCTVMCCSLYVIKTSMSVIIKSWVLGLMECSLFGHNVLTDKVNNSSGVDRSWKGYSIKTESMLT
jgi:hypothetical protein